MLRRESSFEELIALIRFAIVAGFEADGRDVTKCVDFTYGQHGITSEDVLNTPRATSIAKMRLTDAVLTYALVQLDAHRGASEGLLSEGDEELVRRLRNYLAHPRSSIRWKQATKINSGDSSIKKQNITEGGSISDTDFGYVLGILNLLMNLAAKE